MSEPIHRIRAAFRALLGPPVYPGREMDHDAAETGKSLVECVEDLRRAIESPSGQKVVAAHRRADKDQAARVHARHYRDQLAHLSSTHVGYVEQYTRGPDMMPVSPVPPSWARVASQWDRSGSVLMIGPTNTQKTTTATWAAMQWAQDGGSVWHVDAAAVKDASREQANSMARCGLLIVDELHRLEGLFASQIEPCIRLINHRYQTGGCMFGLGTSTPEAMRGIIGDEVHRRFSLRIDTTPAKGRG